MSLKDKDQLLIDSIIKLLNKNNYTIIKDFDNLIEDKDFFESNEDPQPRVARWIVRLSEYSFRIEYRPGKLNGNADSLSRWPIENNDKVHEKNLDAYFNVIIFTDCQTGQQTEDKNIAQLI
ncbi:unnamed protein product [Brachionus calyciflorus]|uniref:Reverse transcriptase RNase H-like domain-containing protein n=1 Tax=Brachionus calyciflorus TaxID=104777 RepID=A0A813XY95_9BILA|nr:unnamed protein product [Brachionus calyciflorus]